MRRLLCWIGGIKPSGAGNHPIFLATRYKDVIHAIDQRADMRLANDDVVHVPKTGIADAYTAYDQYLQQFISISWGFSYFLNQAASNTVAPRTVAH